MPRGIDAIRQRRHLKQGLARDRGVGVVKQMMRTVVASGVSGAIDGAATGCAEGSAPRNGGGGVLVWKVTLSLRPFCSTAGNTALPMVRGIGCSVSCSRFNAAPDAARA